MKKIKGKDILNHPVIGALEELLGPMPEEMREKLERDEMPVDPDNDNDCDNPECPIHGDGDFSDLIRVLDVKGSDIASMLRLLIRQKSDDKQRDKTKHTHKKDRRLSYNRARRQGYLIGKNEAVSEALLHALKDLAMIGLSAKTIQKEIDSPIGLAFVKIVNDIDHLIEMVEARNASYRDW